MTAETDAPAETIDYRSTVFLPKTDFPMRAGLPKKEPGILERWRAEGLYRRLREQAKGRPRFLLHDGPPYANGNIHIGTAVNKILKDLINRSFQMLGYDANYVPGWDCHGLPIEWKIEEKYRAAGKDKDEVPILELRAECREFAQHWLDVQSREFQRLGVIGDWDRPYTTMTFPAEAQIVREIHKFVGNGGLYRGLKPVMWSVVEKTALAEAEIEYHDVTSDTVFIRFPVQTPSIPAVEGASLVIWTTTPWTLPSNRAVAFGPAVHYGVWVVEEVAEDALARVGERIVCAVDLWEGLRQKAGITGDRKEIVLLGSDLDGTVCRHPLSEHGYTFDVPALPAAFVTTEQGTGIVHIAPSHGEDDFDLGQQHGLPMTENVTDDGRFADHVPLFAGRAIYRQNGKKGDANKAVTEAMQAAGALIGRDTLYHSYPHSWRSKAPVIFRATPQWFISMETNGLRETALKSLAETRFVPERGYTRLSSMIENRPDWCISRQRAWGVPIAIFVDKKTNEVLADAAVLTRIADIFEREGSDAWFARDPQDFLGNLYDAADYDQVFDIVDVWFESGSTHAFVLEQREDLHWPATLYLEGSDQHRGWFQSSLLESCGTRGRAPYDVVLTHGFTMDEKGRKMSKSLGNTIAPQSVVDELGADILRLWIVSSDYTEDHRIGKEILKYQVDAYRRVRNTLRYLLGALDGFAEAERVTDPARMPELERWMLHRIRAMDRSVRDAIQDYRFQELTQDLVQFCNQELSAFYFDVRKDSLYCDRPDSLRRRSARSVMDLLFDCLTAWFAPILVFTAEEAWTTRKGKAAGSVHERLFPPTEAGWADDALAAKWDTIRTVRRVITGALERERAEKRIGASLEAAPVVYVTAATAAILDGMAMEEIAITSGLTLKTFDGDADGLITGLGRGFRLPDVDGVVVDPAPAYGTKCQRCWKVLPEVGRHDHAPNTCDRCADAVAWARAEAA